MLSQKKAKKVADELKKQAKENLKTALTSAFSTVLFLAIYEALRDMITFFFPSPSAVAYLLKFVTVAVISVIAFYLISKWK